MPANHTHRLTQLQAHLAGDEAYFITTPTDIEYLSGFACLVPEEREAFLVVTKTTGYLLHASFSPTPAGTTLTKLGGTHLSALVPHFKLILKEHPSLKKLIVDKTRLFADELEAIQQLTELKISPFDRKLIWQLRMSKDQTEIESSQQAGKIAAKAFDELQNHLKVGMTEKEIQQRLESIMSQLGSEKPAFPTIVAFGPHGALPHHQPTDTRLTHNTAVLIDFGATYQHYRSDVSRSWWFGDQPPTEFTKIKNLVDEAYQRAIEYLNQTAEPRTAQAIDRICRTFLSEAGYGTHFIHTTGHGVGLDIHEPPSLYWKHEIPVTTGMILTIEPGIYLEGTFGYRWENTVLITDTGCEILSYV